MQSAVGRVGARKLLLGCGVFAITFVVFAPAVRNTFVDWDDPSNFVRNEHYRGLGAAQLAWMFTTFHMGHYQPLSWMTLASDFLIAKALWGDGLDPRTYHFTNVLLHAGSAVLMYLIALRLLAAALRPERGPAERSLPRLLGAAVRQAASPMEWSLHLAAAAGALLFALHPLRVESVAWATERRDVLSSFLLFATVLAYLRAQAPESRRWLWLGITLVIYVLCLLSRALGMTLPVILLLLDWWPLRRFESSAGEPARARPRIGREDRRLPEVWVLVEKLPFLLLGIATAIVAGFAQRSAGATYELAGQHGVASRLLQMCYGFVFYVQKSLLPTELSPIYELHLPLDVTSARYFVPVTLVLITFAALVLLLVLQRARYLVVAAACYAILILPVSGIMQSGNQEVADRYSYVPGAILALLAAGGLARLWQAGPTRWAKVAAVGTVLVLGAFGVLTWWQCGIWRTTATLWLYAGAVQPESSTAQNGYGFVLLDQKHYDEALPHLLRAIEIQPTNYKAHENIWRLWREQGRTAELIAALRDSVRRWPSYADAYYVLGIELDKVHDAAGAEEAYRNAVRLRPSFSSAHNNLGNRLRTRGEAAASLVEYQAAVAADPQNLAARRNLALTLYEAGRTAEALAQAQETLRRDPNDPTSRERLAEWSAGGAPPP